MRIAYLIPEFPGQTHVWMWREIVHLREWGMDLRLYSTRRPPERDQARHAFAAGAIQETTYLWPISPLSLAASLLWAMFLHPIGFLRCIGLAFSLPLTRAPGRKQRVLPLVPVACHFARDLRRRRIEHLHCHTCAAGAILAMMARRLAGVPFSMTLNANLEWWGGAMWEKLSDARFTLAITAWLLAQIRHDYPNLPESQALLGRIGVDTRKWTPAAQRNGSPGIFRVASVSRLHASKGHDVLLRALAQVVGRLHGISKATPRITLTLIGDGPERKALEALTQELRLNDHVTFKGSLGEDAVIEELRQADAFILASHSEPLGVVYMEAMSLGLPTVGTAAGGVSEIMEDGVTGWLVPPKDPAALAEKILWLMEHPEAREAVAAAGRRSIEAQFDSRIGAATLYERLTGSRVGRTSGQVVAER
jgi:colanic acid/amylovoran biosynthesis glycosyltransferase